MVWIALLIIMLLGFAFKRVIRFVLAILVFLIAFIILNPELQEDAKDYYVDEIHPHVITVKDYVVDMGEELTGILQDGFNTWGE